MWDLIKKVIIVYITVMLLNGLVMLISGVACWGIITQTLHYFGIM